MRANKQRRAPGKRHLRREPVSVMVLGVGSFAHSTAGILKQDGARVSTYLTRDYAHYAPSLAGPTFSREQYPSPVPLLRRQGAGLVIPMSIDWAQAPWRDDLIASGTPLFGPVGEAMRIERERDFGRRLCERFGIPVAKAFVARNRIEACAVLEKHPGPYVIKNPLCSPASPIHTVLCETLEDTRAWLGRIDFAEGVFLQEYLGPCEAGHIALVSGGELYPVITNQEYKRAFTGNLGIVAGAPLGGLVERDPGDQYGLAAQMLAPLLPWFREVNYHGPIQVTAIRHNHRWHVVEYNVRIGVTSGAMMLRLLENPLQVLLNTARNSKLKLAFANGRNFGCSLTLAGYGYPYIQLQGPRVPIDVTAPFDCDVWWNEVVEENGRLLATGHRIADVVAFGQVLEHAIHQAYINIRKIRSPGSYYRQDIGASLWPPGNP